jgi:hypothetical protein
MENQNLMESNNPNGTKGPVAGISYFLLLTFLWDSEQPKQS